MRDRAPNAVYVILIGKNNDNDTALCKTPALNWLISDRQRERGRERGGRERGREREREKGRERERGSCLLYTSDAADDC